MIIFIKISVWHKIQILSHSWYKIMIIIFISTGCSLLPNLISCFIYLKLICNKKRWFQNKVSFSSKGNFDLHSDATNPEGSIKKEQTSTVSTKAEAKKSVEKNWNCSKKKNARHKFHLHFEHFKPTLFSLLY